MALVTDITGAWTPLRVTITRGRLRKLVRRAPDLVLRTGKILTPRPDGRLTQQHVWIDPPALLLRDRRTGWEIAVSNGLEATGDHDRRVDTHAGWHARSSLEVGTLAGMTGRRLSANALGPAVVLRRRRCRADTLTLDLDVRVLTDEMHGRIQICAGDWGLYRNADVDPVMTRAGLQPASAIARQGDRTASPYEAYLGARVGGRP